MLGPTEPLDMNGHLSPSSRRGGHAEQIYKDPHDLCDAQRFGTIRVRKNSRLYLRILRYLRCLETQWSFANQGNCQTPKQAPRKIQERVSLWSTLDMSDGHVHCPIPTESKEQYTKPDFTWPLNLC